MIKNAVVYHAFEKDLIRKEKISHRQAMHIYEELHKEAVALGAVRASNMLDGLEVSVRIAHILNGRHA